MRTPSRLALVLAGAAVAALGLAPALLAGTRSLVATPPPAGSLVVQTSLEPNPAFFGDALVAVVSVDLDTRTIDPASLRVIPSFSPYAVTGVPRLTTTRVGFEQSELWSYALQCATNGCLPGKTAHRVQLPPVIVEATTAQGTRVRATGTWEPAFVVSRLSNSDIAGLTPHFRFPSTLPPVSYNVSPGLLAGAMTALAAVALAAAFGLVALEVGAKRERGRRGQRLSPLQAALAATRQAAGRDDPRDRRKALAHLAATLEAEGQSALANSAEAVAWSEEPPSPVSANRLADDVEAKLGSGQP